MDDLRLIRGTLRGNCEDFGILVERYQQSLFAFVCRFLGDPDTAGDVVQTTFARAYAALRTFRGDASFNTWLHQIALNECRSRQRRDRRYPEGPLLEAGDLTAVDATGGEAVVDSADLRGHVERLPPRQCNVLILRVFSDLPFKEIARLERTTEGAVKVSYYLAVKRLREWMSAARQGADCEAMRENLVDYVDGCADAGLSASIETHCVRCVECAGALSALGEIPLLLRGTEEMPGMSWDDQKRRVMAAIDEIAAADARRKGGFDARILLPLAAGLLVALAGMVSLRPGRVGEPARVALLLAMEDPAVSAELCELLGEPLVLSTSLWTAADGAETEEWSDPNASEAKPPFDDAGEGDKGP